MRSLAMTAPDANSQSALPPGKEVEVYFDGACPLCRREIALLRNWDRQQRIEFTDIANPQFQPAALGLSARALMDEIHARLADGTIIRGVEVFRRLYTAVGWGWLVALTRLPGMRQLLDWGYRIFARNRLRLTGRCSTDGCRIDPSQPLDR
ncbi:thiol-disulfide oxidoreductase DCC family protein [Planctomicrobium sp. SH664]|uniref:thiol-disulfide oxidoreductase DCC family protein n=1 Tax=Planctomicrobium sp. SH664 TaxID=3448125 RepID=UPI003F5C7316